ncbi:hypothetical protein D4764_02G0004180 [Takifugu flavidus]|uniref:Reverse transcriptase domain-containing protein n=1 Tax=Takifugu flavidus TaxID=433684 RepID=A0A5C6NP08_9TELE|nr:hypothetical protein D4764_02G0004180 [Takifugu flavidus]
MCFVDLEKAFNLVLQEVLWGVLREYGVSGPLIWAVRSLYDRCQSLVRIAGTPPNPRLNWKKVKCLLRVKEEILPQVEEFKYLGVLFTSERRMEQEIDRWIRSGEERAEPKGKALNLLVDLRSYPHLWS